MGCRTRNAIVGCFHTGRRARPAVMLQEKHNNVNISATCHGSAVASWSLRAVQLIIGSSHETAIKNRPRGNISRRKNGLPISEKKTRVLRFKIVAWIDVATSSCNSQLVYLATTPTSFEYSFQALLRVSNFSGISSDKSFASPGSDARLNSCQLPVPKGTDTISALKSPCRIH